MLYTMLPYIKLYQRMHLLLLSKYPASSAPHHLHRYRMQVCGLSACTLDALLRHAGKHQR